MALQLRHHFAHHFGLQLSTDLQHRSLALTTTLSLTLIFSSFVLSSTFHSCLFQVLEAHYLRLPKKYRSGRSANFSLVVYLSQKSVVILKEVLFGKG